MVTCRSGAACGDQWADAVAAGPQRVWLGQEMGESLILQVAEPD